MRYISMILTLRLTAEQRERWQQAADREGLPLSGWVRRRCDAGLEGDALPKKSPRERIADLVSLDGSEGAS